MPLTLPAITIGPAEYGRREAEQERKRALSTIFFEARFEFKPTDLWFGVYWKHVENTWPVGAEKIDIWVTIIPCLPLHLRVSRGLVCTRGVA